MWFCNIEKEFGKLTGDEKIELLVNGTTDAEKKALVLAMLGDLVEGTSSSIDKVTAEEILKKVIRSTGNKITAFIVRDKD